MCLFCCGLTFDLLTLHWCNVMNRHDTESLLFLLWIQVPPPSKHQILDPLCGHNQIHCYEILKKYCTFFSREHIWHYPHQLCLFLILKTSIEMLYLLKNVLWSVQSHGVSLRMCYFPDKRDHSSVWEYIMQAPTFDTAGLNVIWHRFKCSPSEKKKNPGTDNWKPAPSACHPLYY